MLSLFLAPPRSQFLFFFNTSVAAAEFTQPLGAKWQQVSKVTEKSKLELFLITESELWRQPATGQGQKLSSTKPWGAPWGLFPQVTQRTAASSQEWRCQNWEAGVATEHFILLQVHPVFHPPSSHSCTCLGKAQLLSDDHGFSPWKFSQDEAGLQHYNGDNSGHDAAALSRAVHSSRTAEEKYTLMKPVSEEVTEECSTLCLLENLLQTGETSSTYKSSSI